MGRRLLVPRQLQPDCSRWSSQSLPVGVPGLLLAGGVNFYGNQVGFSCNSVINYEVILANGTVVEANKSCNSDLF